ncbi:beta-xylosidase [Streptomyces phaeochromogenes]|uniref:GH39 family glycosyl hydrolase n=1 Tax=Streptomyces phaeochromogenes TaxID=1923 RepID=UPI0033FA309C|nr:beta-xylosidase [Streptomyces phaeochromogenes]
MPFTPTGLPSSEDVPVCWADAQGSGTRLHHFWNVVVGAGRANEGLRADWQSHLEEVVEVMGFRYVRFHGLFHDDMFVYREDADGRVVPYFQYVDTLFDRLLDFGIRPFVEFGFMPSAIARCNATVFWWGANGTPPTDFGKWEQLVGATVRHWVARYGVEEVRSWYFEVWNEPNLAPFFQGTRSEYFELYSRTAAAVKRVDPLLRVGGPATSNFVPDDRFLGELEDVSQHAVVLTADDLAALDWQPVWLREFLAFAAAENLAVDFVSVHPYPTDWALDEHGYTSRLTRDVDATAKDLATVKKIVSEGPYPDAEIHLTEWSSSASPRDYTHDHLQAATFVVKANLDSIGLVDSLAYWTFTDVFEESGAGQEPFHGGFGMLNQHGIPKPTYHAYRFLSALGDELLTSSDVGVLTRRSTDGGIVGLFHHYPPEVGQAPPSSFDTRHTAEATLATGQHRRMAIRIDGLPARAEFVLEVVDRQAGNALAEWSRRGEPLNLSREVAEAVDRVARSPRLICHRADGDGTLIVEFEAEPWSIMLLRPAEPGGADVQPVPGELDNV